MRAREKGEWVESSEGRGRMRNISMLLQPGLLSTRKTVPVHETMNSMR
jgi:hypothetical protein